MAHIFARLLVRGFCTSIKLRAEAFSCTAVCALMTDSIAMALDAFAHDCIMMLCM